MKLIGAFLAQEATLRPIGPKSDVKVVDIRGGALNYIKLQPASSGIACEFSMVSIVQIELGDREEPFNLTVEPLGTDLIFLPVEPHPFVVDSVPNMCFVSAIRIAPTIDTQDGQSITLRVAIDQGVGSIDVTVLATISPEIYGAAG